MKTMNRKEFIKRAALFISAAGLGSSLKADDKKERKPNVVFVFADQLRAQSIGCMGDEQAITPALDKMASEGLLLTNTISSQPVCTPYRAQLLTGRYSHRTGVIHNDIRLPDNEVLISEQFKKAGYHTGYIGKWHLSGYREDPVDAKSRRGWDFWAVRNCSHDHSNPVYWLNESKEPIEVPGWEPEVQTDLAIEYIKKKKGEPFCLFLSFGPPHNPYKAPKKYLDLFNAKKLRNRPNVPEFDSSVEEKDKKKKKDSKSFWKKKTLHAYNAMVTSLDTCMGRINDCVQEAGISENTILVFTSDHGDMLGSQGHEKKQRPWEESINVPFIIRYPEKIKKGQVRDCIVSSVDLMPTLLGMCNAPIPSQVDGMDYSATFQGESQKERDHAFLFNVNKGKTGSGCDWRGIRTKEWSYAHHHLGDWLMYDLKNDPYQLHNLIDHPDYQAQKNILKEELKSLRKDLDESIPLKGKLPKPTQLPA
jgi:arylsulfatase A-like enzyme